MSIEGKNMESYCNDLKVSITLQDVKYTDIINDLIPMILDGIKRKESNEILFKALDVIGDDRDTVINSVLNSISDAKKEAIMFLIVEKYQEKLCKILNKKLAKHLTEHLKISTLNFEKAYTDTH